MQPSVFSLPATLQGPKAGLCLQCAFLRDWTAPAGHPSLIDYQGFKARARLLGSLRKLAGPRAERVERS